MTESEQNRKDLNPPTSIRIMFSFKKSIVLILIQVAKQKVLAAHSYRSVTNTPPPTLTVLTLSLWYM